MVTLNFLGKVVTYVQDPDVINDMYNKHSSSIDKSEIVCDQYEPMFKSFLPIVKNGEEQKTVRKAVAHLLVKDKADIMLNVFKDHVNISCDKWLADISKNGETRIDIRAEVERIYAHAINHLCFGEDFNDNKFDFHYFDLVSNSFTVKKCSMREAIHTMTILTLRGYNERMKHPITGPLNILFGTKLEMGDFFKKLRENSATIRSEINGYVQNRKNGLHKSNLKGYDLLSVFLTD